MKFTTPTSIVIFGVTGDLAQRKLFPALLDLYAKKMLPEKYQIIGFSRRPFTPVEFRTFVREALLKRRVTDDNTLINSFLDSVIYQQGLFDNAESYQGLAKLLVDIDEKKFKQCSNKLFYLSVPPNLYEGIFQMLSLSGLTISCVGDNAGWTRILVEKPFGRDGKTAEKLDALLGKLFQEEQIFRIDHYLAKETLQNILAFRFSNSLFEHLWNNKNIESVEIKLLEKLDLEGRGAFYDDVGSLRDVGQNHLLQMLALVAMEKPKAFDAREVRSERTKVFKKLVPITSKNVLYSVARGQYAGFRADKGVKPESETETYFKLKAFLRNPRWRGVPFYLESGKALKESKTEITINFKEATSCLCISQDGHKHQNKLIFRIQPDEGISLEFFVKKPGLEMKVESKKLSYFYQNRDEKAILPDAYEKVLYDCIRGDQTLFASSDEVKATWKFITPILNHWKKVPLSIYKKGTDGPESELKK